MFTPHTIDRSAVVYMKDSIDRRDFLKLGAGLTATTALAGFRPGSAEEATAAPPDDAARRPGLRKSLVYRMVEVDVPLREQFAMLRRIGYDGVEIDVPLPYDREEIRAASEETGLAVSGLVCGEIGRRFAHPDPSVRREGIDAFKAALVDCEYLGGGSVLLYPGYVNEEVSYDQAYERVQAGVREVLPAAADVGIEIAVENVWNHFLLSPLEAVRFVDAFESEWVGWHFDIGNVVNFGWPEQWIRLLDHRIVKVHIKEFSRSLRDDEGLWEGFQVELMEGDVDWPGVMKALGDVGYDGWASAEVSGGGEERLRFVSERMDRILAL